VVGHDDDIKGLVVAIKQLTRPPLPPKRRIGFKSDGKLA